MNKLKLWQAALLAVIAVAIAVGVILRFNAQQRQAAEVPPPMTSGSVGIVPGLSR